MHDQPTSPEIPLPGFDASRLQLRGMTVDEMRLMLTEAGFEGYRAKQLYQWVFRRHASALDEMHNLPKPMRAWLAEHTALEVTELERVTGEPGQTQKALFRLGDGQRIESVSMREPDEDDDGAAGAAEPSLCLSSQGGCALDCKFCLTGWGGFQRNLTAAEIVSQAIQIQRRVLGGGEADRVHHIVFMGMGEPLLNVPAVTRAIRLLTDPDGFALGRRRVTVSTAGIVPGLEQFGAESLGVGIAVSLNATTDAVRDRLMPVNRKWNIAALMGALRRYPLEPRRRITIEYVLLRGENDAEEDARRLVDLLRGLRCKVNLIMYNETPELPFRQVEPAVLDRFLKVLSAAHLTVTVRWSKGREIGAACGQLVVRRGGGGPGDSGGSR